MNIAAIFVVVFIFVVLAKLDDIKRFWERCTASVTSFFHEANVKWEQFCALRQLRRENRQFEAELSQNRKTIQQYQTELPSLKRRISRLESEKADLQEIAQEWITNSRLKDDIVQQKIAQLCSVEAELDDQKMQNETCIRVANAAVASSKTLGEENRELKDQLVFNRQLISRRKCHKCDVPGKTVAVQKAPTAASASDPAVESALRAKIASLEQEKAKQQADMDRERQKSAAAEQKWAEEKEALNKAQSNYKKGWNQSRKRTVEAEKKAAEEAKRATEVEQKAAEEEKKAQDSLDRAAELEITLARMKLENKESLKREMAAQSAAQSSQIVEESTALREALNQKDQQLQEKEASERQTIAKIEALELLVQQRDSTIKSLEANAPLESAAQTSQMVVENSNLRSKLGQKVQQVQQLETSQTESQNKALALEGYLSQVAGDLMAVDPSVAGISPCDLPSKVQAFIQNATGAVNDRTRLETQVQSQKERIDRYEATERESASRLQVHHKENAELRRDCDQMRSKINQFDTVSLQLDKAGRQLSDEKKASSAVQIKCNNLHNELAKVQDAHAKLGKQHHAGVKRYDAAIQVCEKYKIDRDYHFKNAEELFHALAAAQPSHPLVVQFGPKSGEKAKEPAAPGTTPSEAMSVDSAPPPGPPPGLTTSAPQRAPSQPVGQPKKDSFLGRMGI